MHRGRAYAVIRVPESYGVGEWHHEERLAVAIRNLDNGRLSKARHLTEELLGRF